jgi:hypothetical protein
LFGRLSHGLDQARIVGLAGPVHPPRYRPEAQHLIGPWPEQLGTGGASKPWLKVRLGEQHRHAVMDRAGGVVRRRDDDSLPSSYTITTAGTRPMNRVLIWFLLIGIFLLIGFNWFGQYYFDFFGIPAVITFVPLGLLALLKF